MTHPPAPPAPPAPLELAPTYGGFWIRVWASIIDSALIALLVFPILWKAYGEEYFTASQMVQGPLDFLLTWIFPAIAIVLFWIYKSATPGKMAAGLRVVDERTGAAPSPAQCITRYLGYYVSLLPFALGLFWIAFDARKQGFHDKLARTLVIRTPRHHP